MTMLHFHVQTGENGSIVIPATPVAAGTEVEVVLKTSQTVDPSAIQPNGKTAVEDFIDFCTNRPMSDITDAEIERLKCERHDTELKNSESISEDRQAAFEDFLSSWKGCMKGVPHQSTKEIRAERLEKKYGSET